MNYFTFKKFGKVAVLVSLLSLTGSIYAQEKITYPTTPGSYNLDTLRNKKWASQLNIALGAFADGEGANLNPTTAGAYAYARLHLMKRLTISAMTGMLPIKIGNVDLSQAKLFEGRVAINFKKKIETAPESFKLGRDGEYKYSASVPVSAGTLMGLTGSLSINKRLITQSSDSVNYTSWTVTENGKPVYLLNVSTPVTVQQFGVGFFYSRSINFKGRFFLHTNNGDQRKMVRRRRSTVDMAFEFLIAPIIKVDEKPVMINKDGDADYVSKFVISDVNKKYTGWRIQTHLRQGILAYYFEMGGRPGVYFNLNDSKPSDVK
ncbi:MAG: hypothetical protein HYZ42_11160 [Bacteroidetes bacterium]|nr:hypothetical protein [Bacteroidota bacterium]